MTKKVLTILLTALLFLSVVALGGSTVFRVDDVVINATIVSEDSEMNATQLKEELAAFYKGKSILFVKQKDVASIIEKYPYFRVTDFEKSFPDKIVLTVEEEAEVYAVEKTDGGYYVLGETGAILEIRNSSQNRLDGEGNVVVKGLSLSGDKGGYLSGDSCWNSMFQLCKTMHETLGGIRSNVLSVEVLSRSPETFYLITMREGVKIYVGNPSAMTEEKARKAMNEYMALSNEQRMTGRLTVRDAEGEVLVGYSLEDEFEY